MILGIIKALSGWKGYAVAAVVGSIIFAAFLVGIHSYGANQYKAGAKDARAQIEKSQAAIERARQEEIDRADAIHRGAVLARQAVEGKLSNTTMRLALAESRINGLLKQDADRAKAARAGSGFDAAGPDWRGVFGECVARAGRLGQRLGEVGKDAARWADQVNGQQGYIRGLEAVPVSQD